MTLLWCEEVLFGMMDRITTIATKQKKAFYYNYMICCGGLSIDEILM